VPKILRRIFTVAVQYDKMRFVKMRFQAM